MFGEWAGETVKEAVAQRDRKATSGQETNILKELFNDITDNNMNTRGPVDKLGNLRDKKICLKNPKF